MASFDPILYLRCKAEEQLLAAGGSRQHPFDGSDPAPEIAAAFVAAELLTVEDATAIVTDYATAAALRRADGQQRMMFLRHRQQTPRATPRTLEPVAVAACGQKRTHPSAEFTIDSVLFFEHHVDLHARSTSFDHQRIFGAGPNSITVSDEAGNTAGAHLSGGGSDQHWSGMLRTTDRLDATTTYVELDGVRFDLRHDLPPVEVTVEDLPEKPGAIRHLWLLAEASGPFRHREGSPDAVISALIDAGALDPDHPELAQVRTLFSQQHGNPLPTTAPDLPPRWKSVLTRGRRAHGHPFAHHHEPDPERAPLTIGRSSPLFDGRYVRINGLTLGEHGFTITATVSPMGSTHLTLAPTEGPPLSWWARDDKDNHFLGHFSGGGGGDAQWDIEVNFAGAPAADARTVQIMPTGERQRAVFTIPLEERPA